MATASSSKTSNASDDLIGQLVTNGLGKAFDSIKEKVTANVQENGERYLHEAVDKIKDSTDQVVAWAKENPVKTALAVAALAAVSTFLVKTIANQNHAGNETRSAGDKPAKKQSAARSARK